MEYVTGKRKTDAVVFFLLLAVLVIYSPLMRVYHEGRHCEVTVVAIGPDESREELEVPPQFRGSHRSISRTEQRIKDFMDSEAGQQLLDDGKHLEWQLSYLARGGRSYNTRTVITDPNDE